MAVPAFLREVYERNLAKAIKSDYEDWNTFSDGIAYFLTVSETGEVTHAVANGSGVYSGGNWGTYPPLLMELRFAPGRIRVAPSSVACCHGSIIALSRAGPSDSPAGLINPL